MKEEYNAMNSKKKTRSSGKAGLIRVIAISYQIEHGLLSGAQFIVNQHIHRKKITNA